MIFQGRDKMRRRIKRQRWRNALFAGFLIVIINTETDRGVQAGEFGGFDIEIGAEGNWDEDLVEDVNGTVENGESEVEGKENKIVENRNDGEKADGEKNEGDKAGGDSPKGNKNGENKNGEDKNEENKVENDSESKLAKESKAKGEIADKKIAEEKKNAEAVPPAEESVGEKNENFAEKNTINENIANGVENENIVSGNIINENTAEENSINKIWEGENGASGNITGECATGEIKTEENEASKNITGEYAASEIKADEIAINENVIESASDEVTSSEATAAQNAASGNLSTENQDVNIAEENSLSKESVTKKAEKKSKTTGDRIADKKDNGKRKNSAKETDYEMKQHAQAGSGIAFMATGLLKISAPLRFYNNTDDYIQKNTNKSKYNNKNALFYVDNNYKTGTYPLICIRGDNDIMILSLRLDGKEIAWKMEENKIILESMEYGKESCIELVAVIDGKDIVKKQF